MHLFTLCLSQLKSERSAADEQRESMSHLEIELDNLRQELDRKSAAIVSAQSELAVSTEVSAMGVLLLTTQSLLKGQASVM